MQPRHLTIGRAHTQTWLSLPSFPSSVRASRSTRLPSFQSIFRTSSFVGHKSVLTRRYFTILTWIWTSQVHYDARYEAEDVLHRLAKLFQIGLLVFIGAVSGGWSPGNLLSVNTLPEESSDGWVPIVEGISHGMLPETKVADRQSRPERASLSLPSPSLCRGGPCGAIHPG